MRWKRRYKRNRSSGEICHGLLQAALLGLAGCSNAPAVPRQTLAIGNDYPALLAFDPDHPFTGAKKETLRRAMQNSAIRIDRALEMCRDWKYVEMKCRYTTIEIQDVEGPRIAKIESQAFKEIDRYLSHLEERLQVVSSKLRSKEQLIPVSNRQNETHPDRNCMYTFSTASRITGNESGGEIRTRQHYWDLPATGGNSQTFWTTHELARLFLRMDDDAATIPSGFGYGMTEKIAKARGVQSWDRHIDWLNECWEKREKDRNQK